jgi:hypothetical protein
MQAVSVEAQDRPHPSRRQINAGPYQQVLRGPQQKRQNRRRAHDRENFSFEADRNRLYAAWQALANLADLCGKLTVSVYEPLREANLIE